MIPIYEQGDGNGIGHGLESFLERFDEICLEHQTHERAKSFAFIFYDFQDKDIREILKNQGVFARLDRLSGKELSIFYLHAESRDAVRQFNSVFMSRLGLDKEVRPPCVVFFKLANKEFTEVAVARLESANLIHGFNELYKIIERYVADDIPTPGKGVKSLSWIKSGTKFVSIEVVRGAIRELFRNLYF